MLDNNTSIDSTAPESAKNGTTKPQASEPALKKDSSLTSTSSITYTNGVFNWKNLESLRFVVQIGFSLIILGFCLNKMNDPKPPQDNTAYWGAITGLIAWWMPSPGNSLNASKSETK